MESIHRIGIDPNYATGKDRLTWLHTESKRDWAILHTQKRHKVNLDEVIIIRVDIPRSWIRRRWRGIWVTDKIITNFTVERDAYNFFPFEE